MNPFQTTNEQALKCYEDSITLQRRRIATLKARKRILEALKEYNPKQYNLCKDSMQREINLLENTIKGGKNES